MKKAISLAAVICAFCSMAFASDSKYSFSAIEGVSLPTGGEWASNSVPLGDNLSYDGSAFTSISGDYNFNKNLAAGMELGRSYGYSPDMLLLCTNGRVSISQFTPYAKVSTSIGILKPYGIIGAGLYSVDMQDLNSIILPGYVVHQGFTPKDYFGFNVGGGVLYPISNSFDLGVDLRWHHICSNISQYNPLTTGSDHIAINNINIGVKLQFNTGK
jgi:opacity protein-like surface antigen